METLNPKMPETTYPPELVPIDLSEWTKRVKAIAIVSVILAQHGLYPRSKSLYMVRSSARLQKVLHARDDWNIWRKVTKTVVLLVAELLDDMTQALDYMAEYRLLLTLAVKHKDLIVPLNKEDTWNYNNF